MLTQAELQSKLHYDSETGIFTWINCGCKKFNGLVAGHSNNRGYLNIHFNSKLYLNHQLAWMYIYGYIPKYIDHINGDKHDNRIANLREATNQQNCLNKKLNKNNTSGIKGVSWYKPSKKWYAQLSINGKIKNLGYFEDIELAELVVKEAREKYHGDFANHGELK
jgi:hypothetical protein